jgi:hypothetical protein
MNRAAAASIGAFIIAAAVVIAAAVAIADRPDPKATERGRSRKVQALALKISAGQPRPTRPDAGLPVTFFAVIGTRFALQSA